MAMTEMETKEALRAANDWLVISDPPGSFAAREGIAALIPLVSMGMVDAQDLGELASLVEQHGREGAGVDPAELSAAVKAAFAHIGEKLT
ncbi:MAG: hypothetical protein JO359_13045 [Candidatus Eremiobacteraeota bacterium]|nr:hypothetical protein [Candidatus Eremiobacteraeota bacterium]